MENSTKLYDCPKLDDKKRLTSFERAKKHSLSNIKKIPEKPDKGISVFLIDDDLIYLMAMEHYLSQEIPSLKINTFQTGESALLQIDQHPDVIILDYFLDADDSLAKNGISILQKIKQKSPGTKVIMLSSQEQIKIAMSSIKLGAYDYVYKGVGAFPKIKDILAYVNFTSSIKTHGKFFKIFNLVLLIVILLFYLFSHYR